MILQGQNAGEFGHQSYATPCKLQSPCPSGRAGVFLRFSSLSLKNPVKVTRIGKKASAIEISLTQKWSSIGCRTHWRLKVQCVAQTVVTHPKCVNPINGRRKNYGGSLASILKSMDSEDNVTEALSPFAGNLGPKEMTVILKEQREWEKVIRVFNWMRSQKDYRPNVIHYNVVLRALGLAQKWDELRLRWIEMANDGVMPTSNTYSMLIHVYGRAGLVKESLVWIQKMRFQGISPDEVVMNTVVGVLKDAGEYDMADRFYKNWCVGKVELEGLDLDDLEEGKSASGSKPISLKHYLSTELFKVGGRSPPLKAAVKSGSDSFVRKPQFVDTYTTLIDLYGKAGRLDEAANVFSEMLKVGVAPNLFTFNTLIHTCGTYGHLAEAEAIFNKMEERGVSPDIKTYNTFVSLHAESGNVDAALKWYRKIGEIGLRPNVVTYRAVLHMLCKGKKLKEVETVLKDIGKCYKRMEDFPIPAVVQMYVNEGMICQAKTLIEKCQSEGRFSSKIFAAFIDVYAEKGLWPEAETVFYRNGDLMEVKKDVLEYNVMIKAYGKAKLYDKALSLFEKMRNLGTWPDEATYNSLIQMLAGGDLVDRAEDLLREMQEAGLKPRCLTFSALVASYVRLGQVSDAANILEEMERAEVEPNEVVYGSLINGFAEAGKTEEALRYYRMMEEKGVPINQIVLTVLIKTYSKQGCVKEAKEVYDKLKAMEGGPDSVASNTMINLYAELHSVSEAKVIFDDLRQKGSADGFTYASMINLYNNLQMLEEAFDIAKEMEQCGLLADCASFTQAMACYVSNGYLTHCGKLLKEMFNRNISPESATFKVLFTLLKKGGMPIEAVNQLAKSYRDKKPLSQEAVLACVFSVVEMHSLALKLCETLTKSKTRLDTFVCNAVIYVYCATGQINKALNFYMRMQDGGVETDIVTTINLVRCYGKAHMVEGIKRIYSQLKYGELKPSKSLFEAIIDACVNVNRLELAELVSQEMRFAGVGFPQASSDFEDGHRVSDSESEGESEEDV